MINDNFKENQQIILSYNEYSCTYSATKKFVLVYSLIFISALLKYAKTMAIRYWKLNMKKGFLKQFKDLPMGHSREKGCKVCILVWLLVLQITNIILPINYCTCINLVLLTFTHFRCAVFRLKFEHFPTCSDQGYVLAMEEWSYFFFNLHWFAIVETDTVNCPEISTGDLKSVWQLQTKDCHLIIHISFNRNQCTHAIEGNKSSEHHWCTTICSPVIAESKQSGRILSSDRLQTKTLWFWLYGFE